MNLLELFCQVDDFCHWFLPEMHHKLIPIKNRRNRAGRMSESEIMTILIHFHQSGYRNFKWYYTKHVRVHLKNEFPNSVSYSRFVNLIPRCLVPLIGFLKTTYGKCTGVSFVDATSIAVCHNKRINRNNLSSA